MDAAIFFLYFLNFILIGLLPKVFFKKGGNLNRMWWLTASPFLLCVAFLAVSYFGYWPPFFGYDTNQNKIASVVSVFLSFSSILLIAYTLGTHKKPISLWHQSNDAPSHIVTYGAYSRIRHPFYSAFLIAFIGAFVYCPQWGTLSTMIYGAIILTLTAIHEEKNLLMSEFGEEYRLYMSRTGRFFPKWRNQ